MDSMDYRRIVQTLEKGNGVHGLSMDSMDSRRLVGPYLQEGLGG